MSEKMLSVWVDMRLPDRLSLSSYRKGTDVKKFTVFLAGLLMALIPLLAIGTASPANALTCSTSGSTTGGIYDGMWQKHYTYDSGDTCALVTISYNSWQTSDGHEHVSYDMSIETGAIKNNDCVEAALDWAPPSASHADAQIMRNCKENSTQNMPLQSHDVDAACSAGVYCAPGAWWVAKLQVSVYDNGDIRGRTCPSDLAPFTDTSGECTDWKPNGPFDTKGAKIRRKGNDGVVEQNDPQYPDNYGIRQVIDPDH
jgi:hypothetical protein